MPFKKGQSGNPGGRAKRTVNGMSLTEMAREHTAAALATLLEVMGDKDGPSAARVSAAAKVLDRGWGQPSQSIALTDQREPPDLSGMTEEQLEALESLRAVAAGTTGGSR